MHPLHPQGKHQKRQAVPDVDYFFFFGCFLACVRSDAATAFTFFGVLGLLSSLLAVCAGFLPVDMV